ncbi:MAG: hypothetical protein Q7T73_12940 [Beijerinckiaceae bacterium]|nr:hypothetical protein [Beijerinckiaceae bacterium]
MTGGDAINLVGLILTVIGFGVTIWQLVRGANAAIATKEAIEGANKRMILNHMLVLLPQLKSIEADLDSALYANDKQAAIKVLVDYSYTAKQIASLLEAEDVDAKLVTSLKMSAANASASKAAIVTGATGSLKVILKTVSAEVAGVAGDCAALASQYQRKVA